MIEQDKPILYVDDDADDRELFETVLGSLYPGTRVVFAENGIKALEYLNVTKKEKWQLPSLIVLDINMPYIDGRETFNRIKTDPELYHLPIVIFTSSGNPNDQRLFNEQHIEFFTKPTSMEHFNQTMRKMLQYCTC